MANLPLHIAQVHLLSKKKQTITAILGVMFGISMFILMISFMTGVNEFLEETMLLATPHIRLYNEVETKPLSIIDEVLGNNAALTILHHPKPKEEKLNIRHALQIVDHLRQNSSIYGISPQITSQVFYNYGPTQLNGMLTGVNILEEDKLFSLRQKMKSGSLDALLSSNNAIIMGAGLAKKLNVVVGDRVMITTPLGTTLKLRIVGTFAMGALAIDNLRSYTSISTVQKILHKDPAFITGIHVKLNDLNAAKSLATTYQRQFDCKVEDWETANATILVSFTFRNILTYVVVFTLLTVAGFGIYNIMSLTINDKMKDIAILKATGFSGGDITAIFMLQAAIIGFLGAVLGLLLGGLLSYLLSLVTFDGGELSSLDHLPVNFRFIHYAVGVLFGVGSACLAGFLPSRRAAKIDPIEIIRGQ